MTLPLIADHIFRAPPSAGAANRSRCNWQGTCGATRKAHVTAARFRSRRLGSVGGAHVSSPEPPAQ